MTIHRHYRNGTPRGSNIYATPRDPITLTIPNLEGALCAEEDVNPDWWFNSNRDLAGENQRDEARSFCSICPVQVPCLAFAMRERIWHGIWGGLDPDQRRTIERRAS